MAKLSVFLLVVLLPVLACGATGQTAAAANRPAATSASKSPSGRSQLSDKQIEAAIRAKFAKSKINADHFTVSVQGGVAIVEGRTDVIQHKGVATRMCKTAGAIAVNNRVQVSEAARRKAAGSLENARRRAEVKRR